MQKATAEEEQLRAAALQASTADQLAMAASLNAAKFSWARKVGASSTALRASSAHLFNCSDICCAGCGECDDEDEEASSKPDIWGARVEEEETEEAVGKMPRAKAEDRDSDASLEDSEADDEDDDDAEAALLSKLRAARLVEMQDAAAEKAASLRAELGTHKRMRKGESLASLLEMSASIPVVLHVGRVGNDASIDNNLVLVVGEEMKRAAPRFAGVAKLVTDVCIDPSALPAWLQAHTLPALVTLHHRAVSASCRERLSELPERIARESACRWLASERARLARSVRGHDDASWVRGHDDASWAQSID